MLMSMPRHATAWRLPAVLLLLLISLLAGCSRETYTPLMNAAKDGNIKAINRYLDTGTDVNERTTEGKRALAIAASEGHADAVRLLIDRGADVDAVDSYNTTALIVAATSGHAEIVDLLLTNGANPLARDDSGGSPLINAAYFGHVKAVRLLLEKTPELDKQDGEELLLLTSGLGHAGVVSALLDDGVDANGRGKKSRTALMAAAYFNQPEIIRLLLLRGSDPTARDEDGQSALNVAEEKGNDEIIELLKAAEKP